MVTTTRWSVIHYLRLLAESVDTGYVNLELLHPAAWEGGGGGGGGGVC